MGFPDNMNILNNPNIFIGDTGATSDLTPHADGITELKKASTGDDITNTSGRKNSSSKN